jgi:hypothetical protein
MWSEAASFCTCTLCDTYYSGSHCEIAQSCQATSEPTDDGSDGNFYCINGGQVGGMPGSCTCTSCYDNVGGPNCETCAEGYTGDAPWCFLNCVTSANPSDDGSLEKDGKFYCINGGTIGGIAGQCTCTQCSSGFEGRHCETPSVCKATFNPIDLGRDGNFYCPNGGTIGGTTGNCICTQCKSPFVGIHCNETSIADNPDSKHTTLLASIVISVLLVAVLTFFFCFYKQSDKAKAQNTLASVSPADNLNNEYTKRDKEDDQAEIFLLADTMKNTPQHYSKEEKEALAKGEKIYLDCIDSKHKTKEIKSPDGRVEMKRVLEGEKLTVGIATTAVDASLVECAAHVFQGLHSRRLKKEAKDIGIFDLQTKRTSDHCLYYFTSRHFGTSMIQSRQNRCRVIWEKLSNGTIIMDAADTDELLQEFPLNPAFVRTVVYTRWFFEALEPIGDIQQTKVTLFSKVDLGGSIPSAIVDLFGYKFLMQLSTLREHFDKSKEIEAYRSRGVAASGMSR